MQEESRTAECRTLTEAYARLGIDVKNPRRTWSAQGADGRIVVTLWSTLFKDADRRVYNTFNLPDRKWMGRFENNLRIQHLKFARAKLGGLFDSIIVTPQGSSRDRIVRREIGPKMRLVRLDETTGEFSAERAS